MQKIPVVFHNAFVDLGFLYQSYHTNLPSKMATFLADLSQLFPGGVFDTKYMTEYQARFPASYLEYVFRKWSVSLVIIMIWSMNLIISIDNYMP